MWELLMSRMFPTWQSVSPKADGLLLIRLYHGSLDFPVNYTVEIGAKFHYICVFDNNFTGVLCLKFILHQIKKCNSFDKIATKSPTMLPVCTMLCFVLVSVHFETDKKGTCVHVCFFLSHRHRHTTPVVDQLVCHSFVRSQLG